MPVRALTIDFWDTMVVARINGTLRQRRRMDHLNDTVRACRPDVAEDVVQAAYQEAVRRFTRSWRERHTTPTTSEIMACVWDELAVQVDDAQHAESVRVFEEGLLHGPPAFTEGLPQALAWAAARYPLGLISDTMFSPGRVIRRLLDERGVLQHFGAFVFSDEAGFSKPDPRAFQRAADALGVAVHEIAHIGDLRRTDVAGARRAGARAIQYTGVHHDRDGDAAPDALLPAWADLPDVLQHLTS